MWVESDNEAQRATMLSMLEERAASNRPGLIAQDQELTWSMILDLGSTVAAVGPFFLQTCLAEQRNPCLHIPGLQANADHWRNQLCPPQSADLIVVDHAVWDDPDFVQNGLAQLCNALRYCGHFYWTGGPGLWPRSAKTRASILRLCSLHGLRLVGKQSVKSDGPGKPALRGWLLERRNPIRTLVHG